MKSLRITNKFTNIESNSFKTYLNEISDIEMFTPAEEFECSVKAANGDKKAADELIKRNLRFVISIAKQYEMPNVLLEDLINEGNIGLIMAVENYQPNKGFKFISYAVFWIRKMILEYLAKNSRLVRLPSNKINGLSKLNQYIGALEQKLGKDIDISEVVDEYGSEMEEGEIRELQNLSLVNVQSLNNSFDESENTLLDILSDDSVVSPDNSLLISDIRKKINVVLNTFKPRDKKIMVSLFGLDGSTPLTLNEVGEQVGLTSEMVRQIKKKGINKFKKYCFE